MKTLISPPLHGTGIRLTNRVDLENTARVDRGCMPMLADMQHAGVRVDRSLLVALNGKLTVQMADLNAQVTKLTGVEINIGSGDKLSWLLFKHLKLKQNGREKWTRSKARLSADSDVLKAMVSQHPAIRVILDWKEREKIRSTYTLSLAAKLDSDSRLHTDFGTTTAETGRLTSSDPNLQNIPIRTQLGREVRNAFIPSPGNVIGSVDACFHPDTLIKTVYGPRKISELEIGDAVLTYRNRRITYGRVTKKSVIQPKPAYRLVFDNGESVIASHDHRWPVLEPLGCPEKCHMRIKKTEDLVIKERMVPCREGHTGGGRLTWYSRSSFEYVQQHHLVADAVYGPRPTGHDVHHIDEDFTNNYPTNLEYKEAGKHKSDHGKVNWKKQDHEYRIQELRKGIKRRRRYHGDANPNSKLENGAKDEIYKLALNGWSARQIADTFGLSYGYSRRLVIIATTGKDHNHKLIRKQFVGIQPMYAITVETDHNYVLDCGVVTMNSQIEMRQNAHDAQCKGLMRIFASKQDVYWETAEMMYKRKFTADERANGIVQDGPAKGQSYKAWYRFNAKTTALMTAYDTSPGGLYDQFLITSPDAWQQESQEAGEEECAKIIKAYFQVFSELLTRRAEHHKRAFRHMLVWDGLWGRVRWIPQVKSVHRWVVAEGLRAAGNMAGQGGAAGIIKLWMAVLQGLVDSCYRRHGLLMLLQVHDELVVEGPREVVEDFLWEAADTLRTLFRGYEEFYTVPLGAAWEIGDRWGAFH